MFKDHEFVKPVGIRDLEFVCLDAMGQFVVLDVVLGSKEEGRELPVGLVSLPVEIARAQLPLILKAIEDTEAAAATTQ